MPYANAFYPFKIRGEYQRVFITEIKPKVVAAADSKGFTVLCRGGPDRHMYILGCRTCGSPIYRRDRVILQNNIDCEGCSNKKDTVAAATIDGELVSTRPIGHRHRREWRLKCGHVVIRQRGNMRKAARGKNKAGCEECREERYAAEAQKYGWTLLGHVPNKPGYRSYKHTCGTVQNVSVGNMLWGDAACHKCSKGASARPSFIYIFQIDLPQQTVIKLGYSRKPHKRLRHQLGIDLNVPTKVLRTIPMPSGFVARVEETAAHHTLARDHPDWIVPKEAYGDQINTAGEIYLLAALGKIHELVDEIAARFPPPNSA
ncbi:MAG: hypothetical protein ACJAVT_002226 [Yoonia sp.]|jgi:hypothetical protein